MTRRHRSASSSSSSSSSSQDRQRDRERSRDRDREAKERRRDDRKDKDRKDKDKKQRKKRESSPESQYSYSKPKENPFQFSKSHGEFLLPEKKNATISFEIFESSSRVELHEPKPEADQQSVSIPTPKNLTLAEGVFKSESITERAESDFKAPRKTDIPGQTLERESSQDEIEEDIPEGMEAILGFTEFGTTKGKDHSKTSVEGVFKNKKNALHYRQYMNRRGGFNKPLDKS